MISFKKASSIIKKNVKKNTETELIEIEKSLKRIPSIDYFSECNIPEFDNSSMDGIVINKSDFDYNKEYRISGEIKAGEKRIEELIKNESKLIYTGAPTPGKMKKIIIPLEDINFIKKNHFKIKKTFKIKNFVRKKGSDFKIGERILKKDVVINLRSQILAIRSGMKKIRVYKKLKVIIIITGDEIISERNKKGFIPSTNSHVLLTFLDFFNSSVVEVKYVMDDKKDILKTFNRLNSHDLLITSGGISKGKYDLIKECLEKKKLKKYFEGVSIKPGKPTTFGVFDNGNYYLGLPGNPVSCFVGSIFFLNKLVNSFNGIKKNIFSFRYLKINKEFKNYSKLTLFLRIKILKGNQFKILKKQDSSLNSVLSNSDGIITIKPKQKIENNELLEVFLFNQVRLNYF